MSENPPKARRQRPSRRARVVRRSGCWASFKPSVAGIAASHQISLWLPPATPGFDTVALVASFLSIKGTVVLAQFQLKPCSSRRPCRSRSPRTAIAGLSRRCRSAFRLCEHGRHFGLSFHSRAAKALGVSLFQLRFVGSKRPSRIPARSARLVSSASSNGKNSLWRSHPTYNPGPRRYRIPKYGPRL